MLRSAGHEYRDLCVEAAVCGGAVRFNANANRIAISSITLADLLHGAEKSQRVSQNLAAIEDLCSRLQVLPYDAKAAQPRLGIGNKQSVGVCTRAGAGSGELGQCQIVRKWLRLGLPWIQADEMSYTSDAIANNDRTVVD